MPELPEVETIRRGLGKKLVGKTIKKVEILNPKSAQFRSQEVEGKTVLNVWRRAKMLGIDLTGNNTLLIHLKMSGQLVLIQNSKFKIQNDNSKLKNNGTLVGGHSTEDMFGIMPNSSTRVIFEFDDGPARNASQHSDAGGAKLYFNDQRKFGWIKLVQSSKVKGQSEGILGKLGPEPLEKKFTWQVLKSNLLNHKSRPIKVALMDQSVVAGVGNIYANETLFLAKVDPQRLVKTLTDEEFRKIKQGVVDSLEVALKHGGSTRMNFVDSEGKRGRFLDYANVYEREGKPCKVCSGTVKKITLGGRGTYFCPQCQK